MALTCEIAEYQSIPRRKCIQRQKKLMNNLLKISGILTSIFVGFNLNLIAKLLN